MIQNQSGRFPKKWDKSGEVIEVKGNDQYAVKVAGSGRVTLRNRRFLRKHKLHSDQTGGWQFTQHPHENGTPPHPLQVIEEFAGTPQPLPAPSSPTQSSGTDLHSIAHVATHCSNHRAAHSVVGRILCNTAWSTEKKCRGNSWPRSQLVVVGCHQQQPKKTKL